MEHVSLHFQLITILFYVLTFNSFSYFLYSHSKNYFMKKLLLLAISAILCILSFAQVQVQMPQPSPTQTITQNFGMGKITLTYSRPSIKGRTLFMESSDLAPLGKMWRTGANAPTRLTFTDFVNFGGKDLDSGSYVLYTIPGKSEWEIILNKGL